GRHALVGAPGGRDAGAARREARGAIRRRRGHGRTRRRGFPRRPPRAGPPGGMPALAQSRRGAPASRLTPSEIVGGLPMGIDPDAPGLPDGGGRSPVTAFEDVVRNALRRPPCVVTFSGGRDSSAVLAV